MMLTLLFWLSLAWLVYVYIGYPLALAVLSVVVPFRPRVDPNYQPLVTVLFSAKDEIEALPAKMANLDALDYPAEKIQILAVSDGSTDGTAEFLQSQTGIETEILDQSVGKNEALNRIIPRAVGEVLFFTDANTFFDPGAVRHTVGLFADQRVGLVTGKLRFVGRDATDSVAHGTGLYWWYENLVKRLESSVGSVLVGAGSLLAVRRNRLSALYPEVANDFQLPMQAAAAGDAVLYSSSFLGSERAASELTDELRRTARIVARGVCGCRRLRRTLIARPLRFWQLVSHKIMRWVVGPILVAWLVSTLCLLFSSTSRTVLVMAAAQGAFYLAGLVGAFLHVFGVRPGILYVPYHFLALNAAAIVGLVQGLTGGAPSVWDKPASARDSGLCNPS